MRRVSLRTFRANMAKELDAVPFILTRKGAGDYLVCTHDERFTPGKLAEMELEGCEPCTQDKKRVHISGPIEKAEKVIRKAIAKKKSGWVNPLSDSVLGPKAKK